MQAKVPVYFQQHHQKAHCPPPSFVAYKNYAYQCYTMTNPPTFQQTNKKINVYLYNKYTFGS